MVCPVLSSRARACYRDRQAPSAPLPDVGVTSVRETRPVSCEDVTPRSSLLWAHVPIPLTLLCFGSSPRSRSLCRLLPAPAIRGIFPTLCGESFFRCLSPYPGGTAECSCLVLPQRLRPSPEIKWVGVPLLPANTIFRGFISRLQLFRYVQASEIACLPDRSHRCKYPCRAAKAFTSEQNVRRYLRTHRICYPPDYRQLAERGLAPR